MGARRRFRQLRLHSALPPPEMGGRQQVPESYRLEWDRTSDPHRCRQGHFSCGLKLCAVQREKGRAPPPTADSPCYAPPPEGLFHLESTPTTASQGTDQTPPPASREDPPSLANLEPTMPGAQMCVPGRGWGGGFPLPIPICPPRKGPSLWSPPAAALYR